MNVQPIDTNQIKMSLQFLIEVPRVQSNKIKNNYISTTKYNALTFLPLALLIQFKRYANIYFLICAIMQSIPLISPLKPYSAIAPLIFVLALSMLRQGYEDYKRWKSDEADNSQISHCSTKGEFNEIKWKDIKQGDFIKISKEQVIPADVFILICSHSSGISYVETSSLDGEKNLKPKFSNSVLQKYYNSNMNNVNITNLAGQIRCINPTAQIQTFEGQVELKCNDVEVSESINKKNMVLRGCKLKNVQWIIGIVIYTGEDTAIMMNGCQPFTKISNIEQQVNKYILIILGLQVLCCLISAIYCYFGCLAAYSFEQYIFSDSPSCIQLAGISFGSYFILYSTFIPISLIVSLQFVKVFQGYFMSTDKQMYCVLNNRGLECRTVSINEQLGQIDYILTDKTGTLTCNKMQFRNIVVGKDLYGQNITFTPLEQNISYSRLSSRMSNFTVSHESLNFDARMLSYDLQASEQAGGTSRQQQKQLIELIFSMIATCHECVPGSNDAYEGPSPDEIALLNAARKVGFKFLSCQNKIIKVEYKGKIKSYELMKLIEFDSDRKRMTVVLKTSTNMLVFTKGADTSIQKILSPNQKYLKDIRIKTDQMSKTGLRSLWFAYKILPITTNIQQLSEQQIQKELTLVGATGIEDKLQDYVPQTIFFLRSGGIKFVMLTGDKLQTAENIAISCRLIEQGQLIRNKKDLQNYAQSIKDQHQLHKSPVIDGSTLSFHESETNLKSIISKSKSVVFCRVTPGQKAQIVRMVKEMGKRTLAVGDGANDVNMIMEANVGVGIFGQQGTRAAQVANYAIGQFCLLWKLLLYYGRLNYMRVTEMILYFFYKNMVFTSVQFVYCFYALGSGQSFWLSWSITLYNMIFTFWPVVLRAVFEVDVEVKPSKETFHELSQGVHEDQIFYSYYPRMYYISQKNKLFTHFRFFSWFALGSVQGAVCLLLTIYSIADENDSSGSNSYGIGFYLVQISAYTSVIIVVTIKLAVNVKNWTILLAIGFIVPSIGAYILFTFVAQAFQASFTYNSMTQLLSTPSFYIIQFLCIGGMFSVDFLLYSLQVTKSNFQNYLKFKTLKQERLSKSNLQQYMLEMVSTQSVGMRRDVELK